MASRSRWTRSRPRDAPTFIITHSRHCYSQPSCCSLSCTCGARSRGWSHVERRTRSRRGHVPSSVPPSHRLRPSPRWRSTRAISTHTLLLNGTPAAAAAAAIAARHAPEIPALRARLHGSRSFSEEERLRSSSDGTARDSDSSAGRGPWRTRGEQVRCTVHTRDDFLATAFSILGRGKTRNNATTNNPERDTNRRILFSFPARARARASSFNATPRENTRSNEKQQRRRERSLLSRRANHYCATAPAISAGRPRGHAGTAGERERADDDTARGAMVEAGARPQRPPRGKAVEN